MLADIIVRELTPQLKQRAPEADDTDASTWSGDSSDRSMDSEHLEFSRAEAERFVAMLGGSQRLHNLLGSALWPLDGEAPALDRGKVGDLPARTGNGTVGELLARVVAQASGDRAAHLKRQPDAEPQGTEQEAAKERRPAHGAGRAAQHRKRAKGEQGPKTPPNATDSSPSELSEGKLHADMVHRYVAFLQYIGRAGVWNEGTFGMFSAQMIHADSVWREHFAKWITTASAARFMRNDLRLHLRAIKPIREHVQSHVQHGGDA